MLELVLSIITTALTVIIKKETSKHKALENGMVCLLRDRLIANGMRFVDNNGVSFTEKDAFDNAYKAYHNLGGNGAMTELHKQVMELPTVNNDERVI